MWAGRYWGDLATIEAREKRLVRLEEIIHRKHTRMFRSASESAVVEDPSELAQSSAYVQYRQERDKFVRICEAFSEYSRGLKGSGKRLPKSQEEEVEWICAPELIVDFVWKYFGDVGRSFSRNELTRFPDRFAVARWARLIAWYAMQRARGASRKFENNWDDAHYAVLGSYTGHIATFDKNLVRTVNAIFPGVRIVNSHVTSVYVRDGHRGNPSILATTTTTDGRS